MFGVVDGFDNILVIAREVEETTAFAWRAQFGQNIFAGEGHQIVGRIKTKLGSQTSEDPGGIIFEFEVVLGRRNQLVSGTVARSVRLSLDYQISMLNVHIKGEFMLGVKVRWGKFPVHLCVDARHREANSSQHVVRRNVVDMILVDFGTHNNSFVVVIFAPAPRSTFLFNCFRPPGRLLILEGLIQRRV